MGHDCMFDDIDVPQIEARRIPFDGARVEQIIGFAGPFRWDMIPRCIPFGVIVRPGGMDGTFPAGKVRCRHQVVSSLMHLQTTSRGRVRIIVVVLVEPVPPVQMVFGKVRLPAVRRKTRGVPCSGNEEIPLHGGHDRVGPAGAPGLGPHRGHMVRTVHIPEVEGRWRSGQQGLGIGIHVSEEMGMVSE